MMAEECLIDPVTGLLPGEEPAEDEEEEENTPQDTSSQSDELGDVISSCEVTSGPGLNCDVTLSVECGGNTALLYLNKLIIGSKRACVLHGSSWLTPNEFQSVSGRQTAKDWKRSIRHHGKSIKLLLAKALLHLDPPRCLCEVCTGIPETDNGKDMKLDSPGTPDSAGTSPRQDQDSDILAEHDKKADCVSSDMMTSEHSTSPLSTHNTGSNLHLPAHLRGISPMSSDILGPEPANSKVLAVNVEKVQKGDVTSTTTTHLVEIPVAGGAAFKTVKVQQDSIAGSNSPTKLQHRNITGVILPTTNNLEKAGLATHLTIQTCAGQTPQQYHSEYRPIPSTGQTPTNIRPGMAQASAGLTTPHTHNNLKRPQYNGLLGVVPTQTGPSNITKTPIQPVPANNNHVLSQNNKNNNNTINQSNMESRGGKSPHDYLTVKHYDKDGHLVSPSSAQAHLTTVIHKHPIDVKSATQARVYAPVTWPPVTPLSCDRTTASSLAGNTTSSQAVTAKPNESNYSSSTIRTHDKHSVISLATTTSLDQARSAFSSTSHSVISLATTKPADSHIISAPTATKQSQIHTLDNNNVYTYKSQPPITKPPVTSPYLHNVRPTHPLQVTSTKADIGFRPAISTTRSPSPLPQPHGMSQPAGHSTITTFPSHHQYRHSSTSPTYRPSITTSRSPSPRRDTSPGKPDLPSPVKPDLASPSKPEPAISPSRPDASVREDYTSTHSEYMRAMAAAYPHLVQQPGSVSASVSGMERLAQMEYAQRYYEWYARAYGSMYPSYGLPGAQPTCISDPRLAITSDPRVIPVTSSSESRIPTSLSTNARPSFVISSDPRIRLVASSDPHVAGLVSSTDPRAALLKSCDPRAALMTSADPRSGLVMSSDIHRHLLSSGSIGVPAYSPYAMYMADPRLSAGTGVDLSKYAALQSSQLSAYQHSLSSLAANASLANKRPLDLSTGSEALDLSIKKQRLYEEHKAAAETQSKYLSMYAAAVSTSSALSSGGSSLPSGSLVTSVSGMTAAPSLTSHSLAQRIPLPTDMTSLRLAGYPAASYSLIAPPSAGSGLSLPISAYALSSAYASRGLTVPSTHPSHTQHIPVSASDLTRHSTHPGTPLTTPTVLPPLPFATSHGLAHA